jgi:hypothetical protein
MRVQWITAALVSSALVVGCGGSQNIQNPEENTAAAPAETQAAPVESVSPNVDTPAQAPAPAPAAASRPAPKPPARPAAPTVSEQPRREAAAPAPAPAPRYRELTVPAGTALPLELLTAVSSETATVETPVRARLKQPVSIDGYSLLPMGTEFSGTVTEVAQAGRVKGRARVTMAFTEATVAGAREKLRTEPITFEAEATKSEDATKIGVGAGVGAVIGGLLGGGSGAAKGAAIGAGAGTGAVLATKGKDVEVAAGADVAATLAEPLSVRVRQ